MTRKDVLTISPSSAATALSVKNIVSALSTVTSGIIRKVHSMIIRSVEIFTL